MKSTTFERVTSNKEKTKIQSKKRKAEPSFDSEPKNKKITMAQENEKNPREWYAGTSTDSVENGRENDAILKDVDNYESEIAKLRHKLEVLEKEKELMNQINEELKLENQSLRSENMALALQLEGFKSANKKDEVVNNEKENDEERNTRPKRARKSTRDYKNFVYSSVQVQQRMARKKKKANKQDVNQELQKTVTDSDSESETEEVKPPPEDLVFMDDVYPATSNLDKADKEKLANMHKLRRIVWTCPKRLYEVRPEDCQMLVSNAPTVDRVMGSWMSILEEEFKTKTNVPTCYLGSIYFRGFVRRKMTKALDKELDKMKGHRLICYPVCTPMSEDPDKEANHWTLIVLDVEEGRWIHFNTLLATGTDTDWNYNHVKELMDWVDKEMGEKYVETRDQVSPIVEAKMSKVTNPKRENYKDTPQQPKGSQDCGICLLMILEQLMEGKTKEQIKDFFEFEFTEEEVAKYRTRMVQTFLRLGEEQERARQ